MFANRKVFLGSGGGSVSISSSGGSSEPLDSLLTDLVALKNQSGILALGDNSCHLFMLSPGSGISITNISGESSPEISLTTQILSTLDSKIEKRSFVATLCMGFSPTATGAQSVEFPIPYSPVNGTTALTFNLRKVSLRAATPAGGTTSFHVQVSSGTGAFVGYNVMASALSISGSGVYEVSSTSFAGTAQVSSGNKLRLNFSSIAASSLTVTVLMEQT